jgi:hypothetical protein
MTSTPIHTGYGAPAKDLNGPLTEVSRPPDRYASRDFAVVLAQTSEAPAYLVFFPHIRSNRHRTIAIP